MKRLFLLICLAGASFGLQADWSTWQGSMKEIEKIKENLLGPESDNINSGNKALLLLNQLMDSAYTIYDYSPNIANFELILKSILNYSYEDLIDISLENKKRAYKAFSEVFSNRDRYDFRMLFVTQLRDALRQQNGFVEEAAPAPDDIIGDQIVRNLTLLQTIQAQIAKMKPTELIKYDPDKLFRAKAAVKFGLDDGDIRQLQDKFAAGADLSVLLKEIRDIEPSSATKLQQATAYVLSQIQDKGLGNKWQEFLSGKLTRTSVAAPAPKPVVPVSALPLLPPSPVLSPEAAPEAGLDLDWFLFPAPPIAAPEAGPKDLFADNNVVYIERAAIVRYGTSYSDILNNTLEIKKAYVNGLTPSL